MKLIRDIVHGMIIGVANIIPGVSGGTMALVLGIYERLIQAVQNISLRTVRAVMGLWRLNGEAWRSFTAEMRRIDAAYLAVIAGGAILAIVGLARLMTYLLQSWHDPTYGFFFGLVLVSAWAPFRLIRRKGLTALLCAALAIAGVVAISSAVSGDQLLERARTKAELNQRQAETSAAGDPLPGAAGTRILHFGWIFIMGALSISAMILPGVSGSFLLLVLGGYFEILQAIAERDLPVLAVFGAGLLLGVLVFTRLLHYLLRHHYDATMSFLLGLVLGSLWLIWPFKKTAVVGQGTPWEETVYLSNRWPESLGSNELLTLAAFVAGAVIVLVMFVIEARTRPAPPTDGEA